MRERVITLSLEQWLRAAGPERLCDWLAATAEELAVEDVARWRHWAEISERFRDFARTLPVALVALAVLAGCAESPSPKLADQAARLAAADLLAEQQGALLLRYDEKLAHAERVLQRATAALAQANAKLAEKPEQSLAEKARSAAKATE
jgi:hypothetical protein